MDGWKGSEIVSVTQNGSERNENEEKLITNKHSIGMQNGRIAEFSKM